MGLITLLSSVVALCIGGGAAFPDPALLWNTTNVNSFGSQTSEAVVASKTTAYFGFCPLNITAVDLATGNFKYSIPCTSTSAMSAPVATAADWLYFTAGNETFSYHQGLLAWTWRAPRQAAGSAVSLNHDGTLIAVTYLDAHVVVLDARTGALIFTYQSNNALGEVPLAAVFANDTLVVPGASSGAIAAFDAKTGLGLWHHFSHTPVFACSASADGKYFVLASQTTAIIPDQAFNMTVFEARTGLVVSQLGGEKYSNDGQGWSLGAAPAPWQRVILTTVGRIFCYSVPFLKLEWIISRDVAAPPVFVGNQTIIRHGARHFQGIEIGSGAVDWSFTNVAEAPNAFGGGYAVAVTTAAVPVLVLSTTAYGPSGNYDFFRKTLAILPTPTVVEKQCANAAPGPCETDCRTVQRQAICVPWDNSPVSSQKLWNFTYCTLTGSDPVMTLQRTVLQGTGCDAETSATLYESEQYIDECIVNRNFTSTVFLSCYVPPTMQSP